MARAHPLVAPGRQPDDGPVASVVDRRGGVEGCHDGQNKAFAGLSPGGTALYGVSRGAKKVYNWPVAARPLLRAAA